LPDDTGLLGSAHPLTPLKDEKPTLLASAAEVGRAPSGQNSMTSLLERGNIGDSESEKCPIA
jgi:hypothetical protein